MKKSIMAATLASVFLFSAAAFAATVIFSVTAPPYSEVSASASASGVSSLYLTIEPSNEFVRPTSVVTVYEDEDVIWAGKAVAVSDLQIATYWADYTHDYTVEIEETDGIWITATLSFD